MSLDGMVRRCGSRVTIYRAGSQVKNPNGTYRDVWTSVATNVPMAIRPITAELAQELWGQETKAKYSGVLIRTPAVSVRDGVVVTSGPYAGLRFRVVEALDRVVRSGSDHQELGLELTQETFA